MSFELHKSDFPLYAEITPAGALYAVSVKDIDAPRLALLNILREGGTHPFSVEMAENWTGMSQEKAMEQCFRLQKMGFIRGSREPIPMIDKENLDTLLPRILGNLSSIKKAVLADSNGLYIASSGFPHESAEELAGLSADILRLEERHGRLLHNNLRIPYQSWGVVNPGGVGEISFYPIFISFQSFVLIIGGLPKLRDRSFISLIYALDLRYG